MSGYFQRLMARGAGSGDEVHPLSRLPFAGLATAEPLGGSSEFTTTSHPWDQPQPVGQPERNRTVAEAPASRPEPPAALLRPPAPQISNAATVGVPAAALVPQIPPLLIQTHALGVETASMRRPPSIMPATPSSARRPPPIILAAPAPAAPSQSIVTQQPPMDRVAARDADEASDSFRLMGPAPASRGLVQDAIPSPTFSPTAGVGRVRAANPTLPAHLSVRPQKAERAQAEATEVHVSIGRIEITAMQTPMPPKRKPAASRKPLSLDDYLAQRGRA